MWSLSGFALSSAIRLGSNLLMTRLLAPEMFGVMALAFTIIMGLSMFSDVGLKQNVVYSRRGHDSIFLNTAWVLQASRGLMLWAIACCLCFAIFLAVRLNFVSSSSVYAAPSLPYVLAALSFSAVISGFESTKFLEGSRSVLLGKITSIEIISQIAGLVAMLVWVLVDRSVWALVAGALTSSLIRTILSHTLLPGTRNRWQWDKEAGREIVHYGKWILLASVLGFLVNSGDRLILGGLVDSTTLGLYAIASLIVGSLEGVLSKIMSDVAFPAFSEIARDRIADLKKSYYRVLFILASASYFVSGVFISSGQSLINLLYDRRYEDAGWMLALLAASLMAMPFRLSTQSFLALGLPKLQSYTVIVRLCSLFLVTPIAFNYAGLQGALIAIVFSHFSYLPVIIFYNVRNGLFDLSKELLLLVWLPVGLAVGKIFSLVMGWLL
ncbi:oligosaccharide flippase family protein [Bradyrhizobium jicamae]|nr:oligosaccharide flippase family protein [Bradyrhizobium jicamae]